MPVHGGVDPSVSVLLFHLLNLHPSLPSTPSHPHTPISTYHSLFPHTPSSSAPLPDSLMSSAPQMSQTDQWLPEQWAVPDCYKQPREPSLLLLWSLFRWLWWSYRPHPGWCCICTRTHILWPVSVSLWCRTVAEGLWGRDGGPQSQWYLADCQAASWEVCHWI